MHDMLSLCRLPLRELDKLVQEMVFQEMPTGFERWKIRRSWLREKWWRRFLGSNELPEYSRSYEGMGAVLTKLGLLGFTVTLDPRSQNIRIVSRADKETVCPIRRWHADIQRFVAIAAILAVQG